MSNYRRSKTLGASYFFTVVTHKRQKIFSSEENIKLLRDAFKKTKARKPFEIEAIVILPDHLHCILKMPEDDYDFSGRWREIKKYVTKRICSVRNNRNEGNIWQRRFWEHQIRDDQDWCNHMDYIHFNPVKHGYVNAAEEWQWSSFRKWIKRGVYEQNWGCIETPENIKEMDHE